MYDAVRMLNDSPEAKHPYVGDGSLGVGIRIELKAIEMQPSLCRSYAVELEEKAATFIGFQ
jgi:hypothetical protein